MPIREGDALPALTLKTVRHGEIAAAPLTDLFGSGRHVLFALPGAFTPTCSAKHLPGFVAHAAALRAAGVATIACLAVNDAFVMRAWAASAGAEDILMLADGNADLTRALGLEFDARPLGMGLRSQRYAMVLRDGRVERLLVEKPGDFAVSSAENVLQVLGR